MVSLLIRKLIKNFENVSAPNVKQAYASLSSIVGIILNTFLCTIKIVVGLLSNSIAISADGFNNLSDVGTSLVAIFGFRIARYGGGTTHPFGHGRIEWIMGIFTSIAVLLMGIKLADTSITAIKNPEKPLFNTTVIIVLIISILIKGYMYIYNKKIAKITNSETLKATATDCISDALSTTAVLVSAVISHVSNLKIDGYCGVLVSVFIVLAGVKSLWGVLGRIMGKTVDESVAENVLQMVKEYPQISAVNNFMLHDYGFGYFVISMRVEGHRQDSEQIYSAVHELFYKLYKKYHCDCSIQIDYLIENETLEKMLISKINLFLQQFDGKISISNFRFIENGFYINVAFDMLYSADLQKSEAEIREQLEKEIEADDSKYRTTIKGIIRRERFSLQR